MTCDDPVVNVRESHSSISNLSQQGIEDRMICSKFLDMNVRESRSYFSIEVIWEIDNRQLKSSQSHPSNTSLSVWAFNCMRGVDPSDNNHNSEFVEKSVNWSTQDCNNAVRMATLRKP